jgi:hypothetical protein
VTRLESCRPGTVEPPDHCPFKIVRTDHRKRRAVVYAARSAARREDGCAAIGVLDSHVYVAASATQP